MSALTLHEVENRLEDALDALDRIAALAPAGTAIGDLARNAASAARDWEEAA